MTAYRGQGPVAALIRACALAAALLVAAAAAAHADDRAQLIATSEEGFARLLLNFPARLDLPTHRIKYDNGVLAVEFAEPVLIALPDVAAILPDYIAIARIDPDSRGIRFGLKAGFNVSRLEAGERLFIDLLPPSWQGLPPALPQAVVAELGERAKQAAIVAEQKRKALEARTLQPVATVRVGRNPTFFRVQFDWSIDTEARFAFREEKGTVTFDWPVPIDLYELKSDTPPEVLGAENVVDVDGSRVEIRVAKDVMPRFYQTSKRQFIVDIDIEREAGIAAALAASREAAARLAAIEAEIRRAEELASRPEAQSPTQPASPQIPAVITPLVTTVGGTVRVTFPFDRDTAAAVFRRGDTVWMLFDTATTIANPARSDALASIASAFEVIPAGGTKVVRLVLSDERLATLGSEGRSWVLSLGDVLLNATEPVGIARNRDKEGHLELTADLVKPSRVHEFRDPVVGDVLKVVTAFPPARGILRDLRYVDFGMLRSQHGLVVKPDNEALQVAIDGRKAVIRTASGLTLSPVESIRKFEVGDEPALRASFVDLDTARQDNLTTFVWGREALINRAAQAEGRLRDVARLDLAQYYLANQFAYEAIGVLKVLDADLAGEDLRKKVRLTRAIADAMAGRPADALSILGAESFADEIDALMWRSMVKADLGDFVGARADAIAAEPVAGAYPTWLRTRFLLSAVRAAIETRDYPLAMRYVDMIEFAKLDPEQVTMYQLLQGRLAESDNLTREALDIYGQVIAADIRPTRAEAVYRTLLLLDRTGRIDLARATETLSVEVMLWRGGALEADMQKLLAELYFRHGDYRSGFETVKQAITTYPDNRAIAALLVEAQEVFGNLYLNGRADALDPVEALSLYYDYRQLTPAGARGDEMIRNLARRLVKVDLLKQAADLLEYQIDSRLKGVAQAQIAADLAVIRIADRDPEGALRVLNRTRLTDLSPLLERQRRILEGRALIDAGRQDLAIDLLSRVEGRDADLLRVEGYWKSRKYGTAAELLEVMYSPGGAHAGPLTQPVRMSIVKAAVGFVLADDALGLSRLRSKFGEEMARTPEWAMFDFVTGNAAPSSIEFRKVAREVSGLDSLNAFLESYRALYAAGGGMMPGKATPKKQA